MVYAKFVSRRVRGEIVDVTSRLAAVRRLKLSLELSLMREVAAVALCTPPHTAHRTPHAVSELTGSEMNILQCCAKVKLHPTSELYLPESLRTNMLFVTEDQAGGNHTLVLQY